MTQKILERLRNDDKTALEQLFGMYYTDLTRFALRHVADPMVAEEIVQDIFIYLWEKRSSLDIKTLIEAYLYRSVKNKCINYLKSKLYQLNKMTVNEEVMNDFGVTADDLESNELAGLIEKILAYLPPQTAMIFTFSRNAGLTYSEIAEKLNISQKVVEYHVSSALRIIRKILEKHGYIFLIGTAMLCYS
jgi:RNA polymerase sigma-70 factor (ECF subfamily)